MPRLTELLLAAAVIGAVPVAAVADVVLSSNDGHTIMDAQKNQVAPNPLGPDTITIIDVNLRAKASDSGDVVAILGQGSTLNVTGAPNGDWIPVQDPATGDTGFMNVAYVTKA